MAVGFIKYTYRSFVEYDGFFKDLLNNIHYLMKSPKNSTYPIVGKIRCFINSLFGKSGQKHLFFEHCICF